MLDVFFELFEVAQNKHPFLTVNFGFHKICFWSIEILDRQNGGSLIVFSSDDSNKEYLLSQAYVALHEWLLEVDGGI